MTSLLLGAATWCAFALAAWQPSSLFEWLVMTVTTTGATLLTVKAHQTWRENDEQADIRRARKKIRRTDE